MTADTSVEQAIEGLARALETAWNRHDAHALTEPFAEDADFTNVFGMAVRGRAAIEALHAPLFKTMFTDSHLRVLETRVRMIRSDVAAVDVKWTMTGARPARQSVAGAHRPAELDRDPAWRALADRRVAQHGPALARPRKGAGGAVEDLAQNKCCPPVRKISVPVT